MRASCGIYIRYTVFKYVVLFKCIRTRPEMHEEYAPRETGRGPASGSFAGAAGLRRRRVIAPPLLSSSSGSRRRTARHEDAIAHWYQDSYQGPTVVPSGIPNGPPKNGKKATGYPQAKNRSRKKCVVGSIRHFAPFAFRAYLLRLPPHPPHPPQLRSFVMPGDAS